MKKHQIPTRKNYSKPLWAILLVLAILCIVPISAEELTTIDNIKQYDESTQTITIVNTLGLGRDISTIQLNTPLNYKVGAGYQMVAEFEIDLFDDTYSDAFKKMEFFDLNNNEEKFEREFDYKYKTTELVNVNDYKQVCEVSLNGTKVCNQVVSGTHQEEREVWKDLDTSILTKGKVIVGIFTEVQVNDYVEWVPTLFGKKIDEWATWTAGLNVGLTHYWKLDGGSDPVVDELGTMNGTNSGATPSVTGKINTAYDFESGDSDFITLGDEANTTQISVSAWVKLEDNVANGQGYFYFTKDVVSYRDWAFVIAGSSGNNYLSLQWGITQITSSTNITAGTWHHIVTTMDDSTNALKFYLDGVSITNTTNTGTPDGTTSTLFIGKREYSGAEGYYDGIIDEIGVWNRTLTQVEVTQLYNEGSGITYTTVFESYPVVTLNTPIDTANFTTNNINFGGIVNDDINLINVSLIINDVYNETNTSGINNSNYTFTKIFADGDYTWTYEACDNDSQCTNGTARSFTVDATLPSITLTSPTGQIDSHSIGDSLFLNWTVVDVNLDSCWYFYNNTNTTVTCGDNTTTITTVDGEQEIIFYANDTLGNEDSSTTSWTYAFLETGVDFNGNVSETSSQTFEINVTTDLTVLSISSTMTYNETNYTSDASCTSGNCTITNVFDIPLVITGEFVLNDFYWNLVIFNGTDSISITTTTRQQNVTRIHLELCDPTYTNKSLNFTTYDEQNLTQINPYKFEGTFDQWIGSGSVKRNNSFDYASTENVTLCISPASETYFIDGQIDYDEIGNGTSFTKRNYFFQNYTINNVLQNISLYLLKSSSSTSFILKVQDDSLLAIANVLIETHRYYPSIGEFKIVQIAKTDDSGKSVGFFETEIVDYKFIIKEDGSILLETGVQKVIPETSPFTLTFNTGEPLAEPWESQTELEDLQSSLTWNSGTGIVTYIYIDSHSDFESGRLLVVKQDLTNSSNDTTICDTNSTLNSATLTCNVGTTEGFYISSAFITRDSLEELDLQISFIVETLSDEVGTLGLFFGWFLILIASFMFKFNEIAGIWAITITVFMVNLTGLIKFGGVFVTAILGVAIILTWLMER